MRWIASLVAETHRILLRGGVCLVPRHAEGVARAAHPRLLHEASPLAFLVEQAGGRASSGRTPLLDLVPEALHQCTPLLFGSRAEIDRIESYHRDESLGDFDAPLFGSRGLFRSAA